MYGFCFWGVPEKMIPANRKNEISSECILDDSGILWYTIKWKRLQNGKKPKGVIPMNLKTLFAAAAAMMLVLTPLSASASESTEETTTSISSETETTVETTTAETKVTEETTTAETKVTEETTTAETKVTEETTTAETEVTEETTTAETEVTEETTAAETEVTEETTEATESQLSGMVQDEEGNWYYYVDGVPMTGVFAAVPDYPAGDIGGDGIADAADASLILNAAAQEGVEGISAAELLLAFAPELTAEDISRYADIGADGRIDAQDAAAILNYAAELGADGDPLPLGYAVYYADADGVLQSGWITDEEGNTYYAAENFRLHTGWMQYEELSYYFTESGLMLTGWQELGGNTCYFHPDGSAAKGFTELGDAVYWFGDGGIMGSGWLDIDGATYYFTEEGIMCTGITVIDGVKKRFDSDGVYNPLKICLDAGHYAKYNRSPVNSAYWESEMTWKLHLYLKAELEEYGIEVMTTRAEQEVDLAVVERGKLAKGCDLFLSLHSDAANNSSLDMPTAYCTITEEVNPLGILLADKVHEVMGTTQEGGIRNRVGDNGDYYGVLRGAASVGVPGILMEHSYHTNLRSTNWLLVDTNLQKLAEAEAALISDYYLN